MSIFDVTKKYLSDPAEFDRYINRVNDVSFHKYIDEDCIPLCIVFNRPDGFNVYEEIEHEALKKPGSTGNDMLIILDEEGNLFQVCNDIIVSNN